MNTITRSKGQVLFAEGDPSDAVYRLLTGSAMVTKESAQDHILGTCQPGETIGEMGVVLGVPRSATVTLTSDAKLQRMTRSEFLDMISEDREQSLRLLHTLTFRTKALVDLLHHISPDADDQNLHSSWWQRLLAIPLRAGETTVSWLRSKIKFIPSGFHRVEMEVLAETAIAKRERYIKKGSVLFTENSDSRFVYLIKSGMVHVHKTIQGKSRRIGIARAGEFLGEIGVIEDTPRSATAIAATEVVVEVLPIGAFYDLLQRYPQVFFATVDILAERAVRLTKMIKKAGYEVDTSSSVYGVLSSIECLAQLSEHRLAHEAERVQNFFLVQSEYGREMLDIYQRYLKGRASEKEMSIANAHFSNYVKMAGLSAMFMLPGGGLSLPVAVKLARTFGVDLLPTPPRRNALEEIGQRAG